MAGGDRRATFLPPPGEGANRFLLILMLMLSLVLGRCDSRRPVFSLGFRKRADVCTNIWSRKKIIPFIQPRLTGGCVGARLHPRGP